MSTIASPHLSSSSSAPVSPRAASSPPQSRSRTNRAALRDYYGLKTAGPVDSTSTSTVSTVEEPLDVKNSELDAPGFDAEKYVRNVLATQGLEGVLKIESGLIGEIKSLDGEKKALVYDNYSKLIKATDTIRSMRENMGPLTPTTSSLSPAIAHIAEVTKALAIAPQEENENTKQADDEEKEKEMEKMRRQRETVQWVLHAPKRLSTLVEQGKKEEAKSDWNEIRRLLERWQGVSGVEEVKAECEKVMAKTS